MQLIEENLYRAERTKVHKNALSVFSKIFQKMPTLQFSQKEFYFSCQMQLRKDYAKNVHIGSITIEIVYVLVNNFPIYLSMSLTFNKCLLYLRPPNYML